jgi:hypothetical protein
VTEFLRTTADEQRRPEGLLAGGAVDRHRAPRVIDEQFLAGEVTLVSISIFCVNYFNNSCHNRRCAPRSTSSKSIGRQSTIAAGMRLASVPADQPAIHGRRALTGGFVPADVLVEWHRMNDRMRPKNP